MSKLLKTGLLLVILGIIMLVAVPIISGNPLFIGESEENYTLHEKTYSYDAFDSFDLNFQNRSVYVVESSDHTIKVRYYVHEKDIHEINDENDTLNISIKRKWYDNLFTFGGVRNTELITVVVSLPINMIDSELIVTTSNGRISVETNLRYESLKLKSSNGVINLVDLQAENIEVNTSNGSIILQDVEAFQSISGSTSNGRITLNKVSAQSINLRTSNGRVNAADINAQDVTLRSSNGSVSLNIFGDLEDYKVTLQTSNGRRYLNGLSLENGTTNPNKLLSVNLRSSNGNVEVNFINEE